MFAAFEVEKNVEGDVNSQAASIIVRDSDEEDDMRYAATDRHQQHRGENALGQDKIRITIDCEQVILMRHVRTDFQRGHDERHVCRRTFEGEQRERRRSLA